MDHHGGGYAVIARIRSAFTSARSRSEGFTLIEMVVAVGIFAIFTTMFITAVVGLTRGTTRAQHTAEAASAVLTVFQNMDRQVRYADAINHPATGSSGARYVEFRLPAASAATGITTCVQWRFRPTEGIMESRQWTDGPTSVPSAWSTKITTALFSSSTGYPFQMVPALGGGGTAKQQLILTIDAGAEDGAGGAEMATTFVARNSSTSTSTNSASSAPICALTTGFRP
ncbi:PulJ/GspJ family protein [Salinibacterium hongtaonis]|uniref:PulJ/GspJ family protein n=1 Tax=Homoserinimonas hongtaonis TaxID=2079791 RepID=UPI001304BE55|nr:type II secretion system protein [Salinibacterium hongtaonis]